MKKLLLVFCLGLILVPAAQAQTKKAVEKNGRGHRSETSFISCNTRITASTVTITNTNTSTTGKDLGLERLRSWQLQSETSNQESA